MLQIKAYKFQLKTNAEQEAQMRRFAGSSRFVWNKALALNQDRYRAGEKRLNYNSLAALLVAWKNEETTAWLKESGSQCLQQTLKNLEAAYQAFFQKKRGFPRFKKKGGRDSFRFPQGFKIDQTNSRVFLPKLGWLRYRNSREIEGKAKNITVSLENGHWFVSIQTEREIEAPIHPSGSSIGIDLGVDHFAALSDGTLVDGPKPYTRLLKRLKRLQRGVSRKKKGSSNRKKAIHRLSALHSRIANIRRDFLQKASTTISKNHAIVILEDLKTSRMSRSATGTAEAHGRNVKAKAGLNRSILDQGWSAFRSMLEYKQAWRGGEVRVVDPKNTSRTCRACGFVHIDNRKKSRFLCLSCGHTDHADLNAAKNIHAAGHAVSACGGDGSGLRRLPKVKPTPRKQEPDEKATRKRAA